MNTKIEVTFNQNTKRFSLVGPDAMDHPNSKKVTLNMAEIMQIVLLYKKGIFSSMLHDNITKKSVATDHRANAELFLLEQSGGAHITETDGDGDVDTASFASTSSTVSDSGSAGSNGSIKINLWQTYLKKIKEQHTDLTHKQAMQLGKSGCPERNIIPYAEWRKSQ